MVLIGFRINKSLIYGLILLATFFGLVSCGSQTGGFVSTVPPNPPSALSFEKVDQGLLVTWRPVPGALKYTLFWGPEKYEYKKLVETRSPAVIIKGMQNGVLNYFAVTSASAHAESRFSREAPFIYDSDPKNAPLHMQKAMNLVTSGHAKEALLHVGSAIELDSRNPEYYRERAKLREQLGLQNEAKKDLAIAEKLYMKKRISFKETQAAPPEND